MACTLTAVPQLSGYGMQATVGDGALVHPRAEHRADRAPQLLARLLRERLAGALLDDLLVAADDGAPVVGLEIGVHLDAEVFLLELQRLLEIVMPDIEHDVGVHLDEAAIAVPGEALVARRLAKAQHGAVVQAEIEHGIHHAGHRGASAGAHRDQQRIVGVTEAGANGLLDRSQRLRDLVLQFVRIGVAVGVVPGADLGGDGEARRHRQAEARHLREVGAFATQADCASRRGPRPCHHRNCRPTWPFSALDPGEIRHRIHGGPYLVEQLQPVQSQIGLLGDIHCDFFEERVRWAAADRRRPPSRRQNPRAATRASQDARCRPRQQQRFSLPFVPSVRHRARPRSSRQVSCPSSLRRERYWLRDRRP